MHKNLLVVDWDYFFPNPMEGGFKHEGSELFDWSHAESQLYINVLWPTRAASFLNNKLPLPRVEPSWKTFPRRFNLADDAIVYIGDSNGHAGNLSDTEGDPFSDVWLFDAHHDAGYNVKSLPEWLGKHSTEQGLRFSCEDWMLIHFLGGSYLHWRFPTWHEYFKKRISTGKCDDECDHPGVAHGAFWPEGVEIDARVDDLEPMNEEFDAVYVCRSGAWVPPWEDGKFMQFIDLWDRDVEQLDIENLERDFDIKQAESEAAIIAEAMAGIDR